MEKITMDDIIADIEELLEKKQAQHQQKSSILEDTELRELLTEDINPLMEQLKLLSLADINLVGVESPRPIIGPIITIIKRSIRKTTFWLYQPLFQRITAFNELLKDILIKTASTLDSDLYGNDRKLALIDRRVNEHLYGIQQSINGLKEGLTAEVVVLRREMEGYKAESALLRAKLTDALSRQVTAQVSFPEGQELPVLAPSEMSGLESFYFNFEQQFRGSEEVITERLKMYMEDIQDAHDRCGGYILDMGCGRGEFLTLCKKMGLPGKGVDLNQVMACRCHERGLDVSYGDGIAYVRSLPDNSLCAFTAFQVIEHLSYELIWELLSAVLLKLKPGGIILLETVNPDSFVPFKNFFVDPTHVKPLPSILLKFSMEAVGFRETSVKLSSPFDPKFMLKGEDENTRKLNDLLFGHIDYSVTGRK